jgi:hypothetical protein
MASRPFTSARYTRLPNSSGPSIRSSYPASADEELHELLPTRPSNDTLVDDANYDYDDDDGGLMSPGNPAEAEIGSRRRARHFPPPDPRFEMPTPSPWARAALLIWVAFLFWLALRLRQNIWVAGIAAMEW